MAKRPVRSESSVADSGRRVWLWFAVVAAVAFALRLVYLLQARASDPLFFAPQMDALYHHRWAMAVASGVQFVKGAFFRAPLYPWFLGGVYKLFGADPFVARLVQAVLGSASCGLVYMLARRALRVRGAGAGLGARVSEQAGRAAGLLMAAYPLAIHFDGELLIPPLLVFLLLLGFVLLYRAWDRGRGWWLPGLVFGLAVITRPNVLAFLAVLAVWFFLAFRGRAWKRLGLFFGGVLLVMLPIAVRNYVVSRTVVPVAWQGGTNFYIGNNPESDGATAILPGTRASWWGGFNDVRRLAEEAAGRPLKGTEIDRYWFGRGLEFWRRQPGRALGLTARKLYLLMSGYEVSNNRDLYYFKRFTWLNLVVHNLPLFKFPFGVLLPLALAGVWLSRKAWKRLLPVSAFLCAYGLSFVLFFVTARFRMGMVPFIAILAAYAVTRLVRLRGRRLVAPLAIAAGSFLLVNMNIAGAGREADPYHGSLAVATGLYETGKLEAARAELNRALVVDSAPELLKLKATVSMALGRADEAEAAARAALARLSNDPGACGTLGNVLAGQGRLDEARELFARVVELDPRSIEAWNNLGNIALGRNELVRARGYYEQALAIDPTFVPALFHLGLADYYGGNKELARARWRRVLELDPSHPRAGKALNQLR